MGAEPLGLEVLGLTVEELAFVRLKCDAGLLEEIALVMGQQNPDAAVNAAWLRSVHPLLKVAPLRLLQQGKGIHVLDALMRAEFGEFS